MAENNKKLVNADNLQAVAKGVYDKSVANVNTAKAELDGKIAAHAGAKVTGKDTGAHYADQVEFIVAEGAVIAKECGGIAAGTDLTGMSVQEVLNKLLYPHVNQTITGSVLSPQNGGIYEKGSTVNVTKIRATVTKKSEPITKVEVFNGSTSLGVKTDGVANGGNFDFDVNVDVKTNKSFTVKATAGDGKGGEYTASATTGTFSFVYPFYYGVMEAGTAVDEAMVEGLTKDIKSSGNKTYTYTTTQSHAVIAYPSSYGSIKSIMDPNNFENIAAFTKHEVNVTGLDGQRVVYYVYVSGASSVSGFAYTFKF